MRILLYKILLGITLVGASALKTEAQIKDTISGEGSFVLRAVYFQGDTIGGAKIDEIVIFPEPKFDNRRQYRRYRKMIRDLKKVYPYAQKAKNKLIKMNWEYAQLDNEKERKKYIKNVEKEIKDEFKDDIKKLTITQGRYLLKLIDRETGNTSYQLLQDIKGSFSAVFWQTIARVFGHDLRAEYDPYGDDRLMERIVVLIEHDQI